MRLGRIRHCKLYRTTGRQFRQQPPAPCNLLIAIRTFYTRDDFVAMKKAGLNVRADDVSMALHRALLTTNDSPCAFLLGTGL